MATTKKRKRKTNKQLAVQINEERVLPRSCSLSSQSKTHTHTHGTRVFKHHRFELDCTVGAKFQAWG